MEIRAYDERDWSQVWPIVSALVAAADTYPYDPQWSEEQLREIWVEREPGQTVVASKGGDLLGTAKMGPNKPGPGSHISTASFMVSKAAQGQGVGRALGAYAIGWARAAGYHGMQFNAVVEVNEAAVHLWQSLGFEIIGTVPEAFDHPERGLVGLHVMYLRL